MTLRIIADAELAVPGLTVENVAWSRESEARLLSDSDVGLAPLPDTPFTRGKCGFKILQYMAAALPVVASPVGVNADYVRDGASGFHARDVAEWVGAVRKLAADASLRERLGGTGRQRVESEFDTAVLGPKVAELIDGILNE
jgi:glycosyltransferase involved in cell wall biosynthesis